MSSPVEEALIAAIKQELLAKNVVPENATVTVTALNPGIGVNIDGESVVVTAP